MSPATLVVFMAIYRLVALTTFFLRSRPQSLISDSYPFKYFMDNSVSMYKVWPSFSQSFHPPFNIHTFFGKHPATLPYPFMDLEFWKPKMHPCLFIYPNHCCFILIITSILYSYPHDHYLSSAPCHFLSKSLQILLSSWSQDFHILTHYLCYRQSNLFQIKVW